MPATPTSTPTSAQPATHTPSGVLQPQGLSVRLGILTVLAAVVMNSLIVLAAHALLTVAPAFVPLQFTSVIPATVVVVTGALVVLALISRRSPHPVRLFRRLAGGVWLLSIIPALLLPVLGLYPGTTLPEIAALVLMHSATALLCVSMAPRLIGA